MVKQPRFGRVKTRLAAGMGVAQATWWFRHQSARVIRTLSKDPRWDTALSVAPDVEGLQSRIWPPHLPRVAQGRGDLGARMGRLFRTAPPGPVVIIGGDIPGVHPRHIADAFRILGGKQSVFGPANDGGYWLIGVRRGAEGVPTTLFEGVRWSTEYALGDTQASLGGLSTGLIETLVDIDTVKDLTAWRQNRSG